jgi:coenzyme F420-reducing hydrogenase alpha subunit
MDPIVHDLEQARRDLFLCEQGLDELVPEQLHEADRIGARDHDKRSIRRNEAVGDQTVEMGMKADEIVTVAVQRGDHAGDGAAIAGGILQEILDRSVEALAQQAEQLAVVLEAQAQHLGDGDDVLADGEVAQDFFNDMLGKEQGALLMA